MPADREDHPDTNASMRMVESYLDLPAWDRFKIYRSLNMADRMRLSRHVGRRKRAKAKPLLKQRSDIAVNARATVSRSIMSSPVQVILEQNGTQLGPKTSAFLSRLCAETGDVE